MIRLTLVKRLDGWLGDARLFQLSEPVSYGTDQERTRYVIVSAVVTCSGPETYVFAADADANVLSWIEMPGSYRGGLCHEIAILAAGWLSASDSIEFLGDDPR